MKNLKRQCVVIIPQHQASNTGIKRKILQNIKYKLSLVDSFLSRFPFPFIFQPTSRLRVEPWECLDYQIWSEVFRQRIIINVQNKSQLKTCGFSVGSEIINAPSVIAGYEGITYQKWGRKKSPFQFLLEFGRTERVREESETG